MYSVTKEDWRIPKNLRASFKKNPKNKSAGTWQRIRHENLFKNPPKPPVIIETSLMNIPHQSSK